MLVRILIIISAVCAAVYGIDYYVKWHFFRNRDRYHFFGCMESAFQSKQYLDEAISYNNGISMEYLKSDQFCDILPASMQGYRKYCYEEFIHKTSCNIVELNSPIEPKSVELNIIDKNKYEIKLKSASLQNYNCSICVTEKTPHYNRNEFYSLFKQFYLDCKKGKSQECMH